MTTLISWLSVDQRGPSAIYIASDSRITWGSGQRRWDSGRKVFAAKTTDIFGYCGDVLFPSLVLGQLVDLIDKNLLWEIDSNSAVRHAAILSYLKISFSRRHDTPNHDFSILHCVRNGEKLGCSFELWQIDYKSSEDKWIDRSIDVSPKENTSRLLVALGSGAKAFEAEAYSWTNSSQGQVSRAYFSAFCDALKVGADELSGGMPQLVSLDRQNGGKVLGYVSEGVRYIYGLPISYLHAFKGIEWVDERFQRLSPETLDLLSGAQRQAKPTTSRASGFASFFGRIQR